MAEIRPFKGVVYNRKKIKNLARVMAPPYDIIPTEMQNGLYRASPHNIVRLILGKIKRSDDVKDNRYTRARKFFESRLKKRIMLRDKKESIYIYSQNYNDGACARERVGFIALMRLDSGRKRTVLAHENTLLAPKLDRLDLIREVKSNLSPIFVLYEDPRHKILDILKIFSSRNKPFIDIYFDKTRHKVLRLEDPRAISEIEAFMKPKDIFIADGHHRYEAALTYSMEVEDKSGDKALRQNSKYMMVYFVESNESMLTILPAYRLVRDIGALKEPDIKERLERFFYIEKVSSLKAMMARLDSLKRYHAFGAYLGKGVFYIIRIKDVKHSDFVIKNKPKAWRRLDVTILHLFIMQHVLGLRDDDDNVEFVKDAESAPPMVDSGKFKIAFFLNPTKVSQVKEIAKLGERMPRKATYFYPKPLSGLVINKLY